MFFNIAIADFVNCYLVTLREKLRQASLCFLMCEMIFGKYTQWAWVLLRLLVRFFILMESVFFCEEWLVDFRL